MNAQELRERDPARFESEYDEWLRYNFHYDWWDSVEEMFKEDMEKFGLMIKRIYFNLSYCQGDYASFEGHIHIAEWMRALGYADEYPALILALDDYGCMCKVNDRNDRPIVDTDSLCLVGTYTTPQGIFADLHPQAWVNLVEEQADANPWDVLIDDWMRDRARQLYRTLQEEYEYLSSEDSFVEHCDANGIKFEEEEACISK